MNTNFSEAKSQQKQKQKLLDQVQSALRIA